ncbi:MAG: hypothetical protein HYR51_01415 [Candidatus Rokubacteria bacterium]|nr:hypothetical protein [Candidatus Rokubacteria bacterium]
MTFSGGSYGEVGRWVRSFLTSHAKRVDPRIEVDVEADGEREGVSYGARLRLGQRTTGVIELDYKEVAANRGNLAWCAALAERVKQLATTELTPSVPVRR